MIIKKATEMKKDFIGWCKKQYYKVDDFDGYKYEWILSHPKKIKNYLVVLQGRTIKDIIHVGYQYGVKILSPFFVDGKSQEAFTLESIKKYFKDSSYVIATEWVDVRNYGYTICNLHTSVDLEHRLNVNHKVYSVANPNNINIMRDAIEKKYLPILGNITFKLIDGDKVTDYLYDKSEQEFPSWIGNGNHTTTIGFHYLKPDCYENHKLLVAESNGRPVAAIKYGIYSEGKSKHYGINYIDVNSVCRGKGLAKAIINELTKHLPSDYPLVLSYESEMGKLCKMQKHFKDAPFKTTVYTDKEWENYQWELIMKKAN